MSFKIAQEASQIADNISILCDDERTDYSEFSELSTLLKKEDYVQDSEQMFKLEKLLYPAKIIDAEIPTFIVPIQYWYAKNLFDGKIAQQLLFGATEDTIFKRESVYYKSKYASGGLKTPARILWYVSKSSKDTEENRILNLQSIRACSRLDEIIIDVPKSVYKRFRRLGIFTFQQVLKVAKDDQEKQIMALKFSDTELFEQPIELKELREIIPSLSSLQAPQKISNKAFIMIYNKGRNLS